MNFTNRQKIAIIGTGISGMGAAYLLQPHHDITLFEKNDYIGGHSRTINVKIDDQIIPVDTGFIVFNQRNYPLLSRLFGHLDVPLIRSNMSFGISIDHGWLEFGTPKLRNIFAQKRNLLRPLFWRMLWDILKFYRSARPFLDQNPDDSLGNFLDKLKLGPWFQNYFLLAMGGAIWSTPVADMLKFPAASFVRFFENHGLLARSGQPQWYTVAGGSREYIDRLVAPFRRHIRLNCGVKHVLRQNDGVVVVDGHGQQTRFDQVIFACHADQALAMIDFPHPDEQKILSTFRYQPNRAVLHGDISFMPKRRAVWSSWVYLSEGENDFAQPISLSYWMNNLQSLKTKHPLMVTLNPHREADAKKIYNDFIFEHPVMDAAAIESQKNFATIQGVNRFWYCGAYLRYGFHEDGLESAVKVAHQMGINPPWS
ncbi:MAG: FAD-dependent oxidoreductase [Candidatus Symbiobacter sp.]|nr:FAD-dependent oxidoreductase [Candidatus Symbiobacter sp.]